MSYDYPKLISNQTQKGMVFDTLEKQFIKYVAYSNSSNSKPSTYNENQSRLDEVHGQIYSFFKTGLYELIYVNKFQEQAYMREIMNEFGSNSRLALVMMLISVSSIFVIILAVIPNFSKIE